MIAYFQFMSTHTLRAGLLLEAMCTEGAPSLDYRVCTSSLTMREGMCNRLPHSPLLLHYTISIIWVLRYRRGRWTVKRVHMGDDNICHGGLVGEGRARHIISFGEDECGTCTSQPLP